MNWTRIQDNWRRITARTRKQWGKLAKGEVDDSSAPRIPSSSKVGEHPAAAEKNEQMPPARWQEQADAFWFSRVPRRLPFKRR